MNGKKMNRNKMNRNKMNRKKTASMLMGLGSLVLLLSGCGSEKISSKITEATDESTNQTEDGLDSTTTDYIDEEVTAETIDQSTDATADSSVTETSNNSETKADAESTSLLENTQEGEVIEITEKMYVTFINDIYTNTEDYLGKTISIEGMFTSSYFVDTYTTYYYVYRVGPGCCGNDGNMCGFEFTFEGDMPADNDWISVVGTLEEYEENGVTYLTIKADQVMVMEERGEEVVNVY
jgi:putative membrane protein